MTALGYRDDTIAAPITAPGQAAVSIVRISGSLTKTLLAGLCKRARNVLERPRELVLTPLYDLTAAEPNAEKCVLDSALVVFFPSESSFTGEESAEFHLHGSSFLVSRFLENLTVSGARLALPGEFTQRAYLNGRIDLTQAEAIADLVSAETEAQARVANEQLSGRLSEAISGLGEPLRELLSEVEAWIDFPEEDIKVQGSSWLSSIEAVEAKLEQFIESYSSGRMCREGARVVLSGVANVGKSSLLNRLLGEDRVIVTPVPGTTRDSIEERVSLGGLSLRLSDTAGLECGKKRKLDEVEKLGMERSWVLIDGADLVVFMVDVSSGLAEQKRVFESVSERASRLMLVANKIDLFEQGHRPALREKLIAEFGTEPHALSALSKEGLSAFRETLIGTLWGESLPASSVIITNQRHFEALKRSEALLGEAKEGIAKALPIELIAVDLRAALGALSDIIGVTTSEDILGRIFSRFCIGK